MAGNIRRPRQTQGGARQGIILLTLVSDYYRSRRSSSNYYYYYDYYYYYYLYLLLLLLWVSEVTLGIFGGAILGLLRPSEAWCFPAGR